MMNRFFFVLLLLTLFSISVHALPPDVNFSFNPTSPMSNENIVFTPDINFTGVINNMKWQFDTDGNVNFFGGQLTKHVDSNFVNDFFTWTQGQGVWSNTGGLLQSPSTDSQINKSITLPTDNFNLYLNTRIRLNTAGVSRTCFNEPEQSAPLGGQCSNYSVVLNGTGPTLNFQYGNTVIGVIDPTIAINTLYDINVIVTPDHNFSFYVNGVLKASFVDTTSDINGEFLQFVYADSGTGFGNWGYTTLFTETIIDTTLPQTHAFSSQGSKNVCLTAGNADGNTTACNIVTVTGVSPTVDFSITPSSGSAFQSILFNPDINAGTGATINNMKWQFDTDGNVNFFAPPPINIDLNQSHTFMTAGIKTICLTAGNNDANITTCHSLTISQSISFIVYDENTNLPIPFPQATVNGNTFTGDANGNLNIVSPTVEQETVVTIFATNYPPRLFTYLLDINFSLQENIYLLDVNKGRNIEFLLRDINSTKYPNSVLRIEKNGKLVSKVVSNNEAITDPIYLANIVTDYNFFIDANTDTSTNIIRYGNTTVTVLVPKNENTEVLVTPFELIVSDLTSIDINNLVAPRNVNIYPNTFHPYKVTIDVDTNNSDYFPRYYTIRSLGGQTSLSLQPYLLSVQDNALSATLKLSDSFTAISLPYYVIKFYADVGSLANELVESPQSDSAGELLFTSITGKSYFIQIYNEKGDLVKQGDFISNTSSTYFIDIFSGIISNTGPTTGIVDVNVLYPTNNYLFLNDSNNFGFIFKVESTGPSIFQVIVTAITNGTTLYSNTFTPSFPSTTFAPGTQFDTNISTSLNNVNVQITVSVLTSQGTVTENYLFPLKQESNPSINFPGLTTLCSNVGALGCSLIYVFIGLMISLGLRFNPVFGVNNNGMFWVMVIWTGIGSFMGLLPYTIGFIAIIGGIGYWATQNQPIG